jgi:hypothetical protein
MRALDSAAARSLLSDSLTVWRVHGVVEASELPVIAVIHAEDGTVARVESAIASEAPIRWWVRWQPPGAATSRSRPCTSIVMLLRTVRVALGAENGNRLRLAPTANET